MTKNVASGKNCVFKQAARKNSWVEELLSTFSKNIYFHSWYSLFFNSDIEDHLWDLAFITLILQEQNVS